MADAAQRKAGAFLLALLSIVLLSTNSAAVVVTAGGFDPVLFSLGATTVSLAVSVPSLVTREARAVVARLLRLWSFRGAVLLKAINDLAFYLVIISTQQIEAAVIVYLYPIFNLLVGCLILPADYARPGLREWGLIALSFVSILLLTPIYGLADLTLWGFATALLSAAASIYVVLLQSASEEAVLPAASERSALAALFAGSFGLHLIVLAAGVWMGVWPLVPGDWAFGAAARADPAALIWPLAGMVWVGIVVNVLSESLWLRAARRYRTVSLKSLFYLSPVLTAVYFAVLDIDTLTQVVVFCLAAVVATNYLLHDREIDDPSLIAFLFGLIGTATFFKLTEGNPIPAPVPMTQTTYESFITFSVIIIGFLLSRALNLSQANSERLLALAERALPAMLRRGASCADCEEALARLAARPDVFLWEAEMRRDRPGRLMIEVIGLPEVAPLYLAFLNGRLVGVSRPEILLTTLLSLVAVAATVSQAMLAERGYFLAAFSTGILLFIPVLIREYTALNAARQYAGIVARRGLGLLSLTEGIEAAPPATGRHLRTARLRTILFTAVSVAVTVASWAMLSGWV